MKLIKIFKFNKIKFNDRYIRRTFNQNIRHS